MKSVIYLCGAGNAEGVRLALRINEKKKNWEHIYILDDDPLKTGKKILGVEVIGPFNLLSSADPSTTEVANLVAGTTLKRKEAFKKIERFGIPFVSLIDPTVDIFGVEFRGDITIYPNVTFSAGAFLDQGSVAFTGSVIGHGCTVGKFCIIAPGAVLNARITVEDGAYIGTNSSILPDLKIGAWATIGLNSGVVSNIPAGSTAMGVPAELIMVPGKELLSYPDTGIKDEKVSKKPCSESPKDLEKNILEIWKEILKIEKIKSNDNFFDLGGHSLLAIQLFGKLKNVLNLKINLIDIFHYPTIKSFVAFLSEQSSASPEFSVTLDSKRVAVFRQRFPNSSSGKSGSPDDFNIKEISKD
jgi:acetyltransferase-like isoleucine patch superfamily enzyme/acyl carrier protein